MDTIFGLARFTPHPGHEPACAAQAIALMLASASDWTSPQPYEWPQKEADTLCTPLDIY